MRSIPLTKGLHAIVDDEEYERLAFWNWYAKENIYRNHIIVARQSAEVNGKRYLLLMHREVMNCDFGDGRIVDHINGNTLDNRRVNLRFVTPQQNNQNRTLVTKNRAGYKGVRPCGRRWEAQIIHNRKSIWLGAFDTPLQAHEAYLKKARELFGPYLRNYDDTEVYCRKD